MKPLNCPKLIERLSVLVELKDDPQIRGPARARVTGLWIFFFTLWEVHHRRVIMPLYARSS